MNHLIQFYIVDCNVSGIIDRNTIAATTGEHTLTSVQMNYYLNDYIRNWASSYGENLSLYAGMMGLDVNKPISEQVTDETTGETWADRFLTDALRACETDSITNSSRLMTYDTAGNMKRLVLKEGDTVTLTQENLYNGNGQRIRRRRRAV